MRHLDVSPISSTAYMPVKQGIWQHIQAAYGEAIGELGKALFGSGYDPTKVYILQGCVNSGTGSTYNITAGSVFFNGEVYLVDAASFALTGSNVAECTLVTTYLTGANADSVQFTDGSIHNIHQIVKCVIGPALAGSGIGDYSAAIYQAQIIQAGIGQIVEWDLPSGVLSDWFDSSTGNGLKFPVIGYMLTNKGVMTVGVSPGDSLFGTVGNTGGGKTQSLVAGNLPSFSIPVPASNNGTANGSEQRAAWSDNEASNAGNINANYTGTATAFSIMNPYITVVKIKRFA